MKKESLLLGLVVFLIVAAAALTFCVTLVLSSPFQLKYYKSLFVELQSFNFNETLLKYASIDLAEPQFNQEIDELLQGNLTRYYNKTMHGSFLSYVKNNNCSLVKPMSSARGLLPMEVRSPPPEFCQVWLSYLQDWFRKRILFEDDIMLDLMNVVKGDLKRDGKMVLKNKYRSCAVVGNSGILLKTSYGGLIDSHEVVIRLNYTRTGGFENYVGKKTTISFMNSNILNSCAIMRDDCFCHPYGMDVPIVVYICQPPHFYDYIKCNSSHKAPLIATDPRFDVLCARIVKYYSLKRFFARCKKGFEDWSIAHGGMNFHYSSGMQAVMLAVGVCDKVSIFGFGKSADAKHHYHTNQKYELELHDYEAEYDLYHDLVSKPMLIPFISDKFKFPTVDVYH